MDPFVGELRLMPYNFAPRGWALCQGQLLAISQNTALFSLLGTTYGGNGSTTFGLPDLRGRAVVGMGQGPGLANYPQGTATGTETVMLLTANLPAHSHPLSGLTTTVSTAAGANSSPASGYFAAVNSQYSDSGGGANMAATLLNGTTSPTGGTQAHDNHMPYLVLSYCIALQGIYPQRS